MKTLFLADKPPSRPIEEILAENPDIELIVTLGDLFGWDLLALKDFPHIKKLGVYGNHCDGRYMEELGIKNMHMRHATIKGISFIGYQGCFKYKNDPLLSTQEECIERMKNAPRADVLITHCPPTGINDDPSYPPHNGLDGLLEYVDRTKPKYLCHGHTHDNGEFVTQYNGMEVVYVYGERIVDLKF